MFIRHFFGIFLALVFSIDVFSQAGTYKLAVVGSSTAAGFGVLSGEEWPARVKAYYEGLGQGITITLNNIASGGTNCYTGMPTGYVPATTPGTSPYNLPDANRNITKALSYSPNAIIINYPSTDYNVLSTSEIIACFQAMKDAATTAGVSRCYIASTQPRNTFSTADRQKLQDIRDLIMTTFGSYAIDFFTDVTNAADDRILASYAYGDDIHLNAAGQNVLAQKVIASNVFGLVLPVKYDFFKADKFGNKARIQWKTNLEDRNDYFTIERSIDGRTYQTISTVTTKGNGNGANNYTFMDAAPNQGLNLYRIKQTDIDGKFTYSAIAKLNFTSNGFDVSPVYPNPVSNAVKLNLTSNKILPVEITIQDISGRIVKSEKLQLLQGTRAYETSIENLRPGMYSIKITAAGQSTTQTFVKSAH